MILYSCEPNPSGKGSFMIKVEVPIHKGDHLIHEGTRYEVLLVKHITAILNPKTCEAVQLLALVLGRT